MSLEDLSCLHLGTKHETIAINYANANMIKLVKKSLGALKLNPPYSRYAEDTFSVRVKPTAPNSKVSHISVNAKHIKPVAVE